MKSMENNWDEERKEMLEKFLKFDYFKIIDSDDNLAIKQKCAIRAYWDMCRTLEFSKQEGKSEKEKKEENIRFRTTIIDKEIIPGSSSLLRCKNPKSFDNRHTQICKDIQSKAKNMGGKNRVLKKTDNKNGKAEAFYFGQAQKWLNMTIKYMWLLGLWPSDRESCLHVPVDNYIIKEIWGNEKIEVPLCDESKARGAYNEQKVVPWSKWDCDQYLNFQESLREYLLPEEDKRTLIQWEYDTWLKAAAEKRR